MSTSKLIAELRQCTELLFTGYHTPDEALRIAEVRQRIDAVIDELQHLHVTQQHLSDPFASEDDMTLAQARRYVRKVLDGWPAFCQGHPKFARALKVLLRHRPHE